MVIPMTTFKLLHDAGFSKDKYRRLAKVLGGVKNYGRNTPISIVQILNICGLYSAVWALRACPNSESFALLFVYDCIEWQEHHFRELLTKELLAEKDIDPPEE